jgi:cytochrome P450 family 135
MGEVLAKSAVGEVTGSSGPLTDEEATALSPPPMVNLSAAVQLLRFSQRQTEFVFGARRRLGPVFSLHAPSIPAAVTGRSDDVRSLFTAKPEEAPSLAARSALRPYVGSKSALTAVGKRHMRQRKLLLPPFHGEAIKRYTQAIADATEREIDRWPLNREFALAPRMQAITLDVIMAGIFGIEGRPKRGTAEHTVRSMTKYGLMVEATGPIQIVELMNVRRKEPYGLLKFIGSMPDRGFYALIKQRRQAEDLEERRDILSLLLQARTEEGEMLTDEELRGELLALVLAGHETTGNSLAWAWERLTHNPSAHERLREAVRTETDAEAVIEQTITETMRCRPVVPLIGRRVKRPWRLGSYAVPAATPVMISILLLHHQEDVYSDPFEFQPQRWIDRKPGTYEWLPFGGGIRRCLGSSLAMAEQRAVLEAMSRRLDIEAADPAPERAAHRNVTMVPARGARVVVRSRQRPGW